MNILERLVSFGATFIENSVEYVSAPFVLNSDMAANGTTLYGLRWHSMPSRLYVNYDKARFDEFAKFLIERNFKVLLINCLSTRYPKDAVFFVNDEYKMLVDVSARPPESKTQAPGAALFDSIMMGDEDDDVHEDDDDAISHFSVSFNAACNPALAFELRNKFFKVSSDEDAEVLLFEKDEYKEMVLTPHKVKGFSLDFDENYNDDFKDVHQRIDTWVRDFKMPNNKLCLLHGVPGSGKTNYIKYLLNNVKGVKKIYIPPYFVQSMADPSFLPIIKKEKNSLLVIEDAEKVLVKRDEASDASVISILLNLCDGIMADVLNFKIIATFNTDEDQIDAALKRRGRMFLKYKFDELTKEKTDFLFRKLYSQPPPKDRMTLAEIYNDENTFGAKKEEKRSMGFL